MDSKIIAILLILLSGFFISCSEQEGAQQEVTEKEVAFDELESFLSFEADSIASPADIAFLSEETIAVFDDKLISVLLYDTNGNLLDKFGKKGKGPGEFAQPAKIQVNGDQIYVFDFADFGISEFNTEGNFVEQHTFEGGSMGFAQTLIIDSGRYLTPANGEQGSLLQIVNSATDSSFYFGKAKIDKVNTYDLEAAQQQISNREIPDMFKNFLLIGFDDDSYYAFLQSYGQLQRYDNDGNLLWEKTIELPIKEKIFDRVIERNENVQTNTIYPLTYANDMQVTHNGIYIMMNVPEDEKEIVIKFNKDGSMDTIYRIDNGESSFSNFRISPSGGMLYLTDMGMGNIYRIPFDEI